MEYTSQPSIWDTRDTMGKYAHGPVCYAGSDLRMTLPITLSKEQPLILFSFKQKIQHGHKTGMPPLSWPPLPPH